MYEIVCLFFSRCKYSEGLEYSIFSIPDLPMKKKINKIPNWIPQNVVTHGKKTKTKTNIYLYLVKSTTISYVCLFTLFFTYVHLLTRLVPLWMINGCDRMKIHLENRGITSKLAASVPNTTGREFACLTKLVCHSPQAQCPASTHPDCKASFLLFLFLLAMRNEVFLYIDSFRLGLY